MAIWHITAHGIATGWGFLLQAAASSSLVGEQEITDIIAITTSPEQRQLAATEFGIGDGVHGLRGQPERLLQLWPHKSCKNLDGWKQPGDSVWAATDFKGKTCDELEEDLAGSDGAA